MRLHVRSRGGASSSAGISTDASRIQQLNYIAVSRIGGFERDAQLYSADTASETLYAIR